MGIVWTFRGRGLAPSLGAGGSLVVAALCCLLLATAFISFRDWPSGGGTSPGGTITMTPPAAKAAGRAASGPSAPAVAVAVAAPVVDRAAGDRGARRGATRRAPASAPAPAGTNPPPAPAPAPAPASPRPASSAPAAPVADPQPPAREPGRVEQLVQDVRQADDALPLPPAVKEPVEPVLETVQQVGRTVDETTGPLLPALP